MSSEPPPRETCHKTGVVMTCYVDGKKRFRATDLAQESPTAPAHGHDGDAYATEPVRVRSNKRR